jgi:molybdate/tungstate transport system substrate-binding protein
MAIAIVVIVVVVAAALAYVYSTDAGSGSASSTITTTSTTGSLSISSSPLISFSADAYATEATALLQGFSRSTGVPVAPVKSAGSFADANQIAAGAPDDVFISVALSATSFQYLKNLTANWAVGFASDQMVLAYSNVTSAQSVASEGKAAAASNSTSDWNAFFASLTSGQVKVGISNPVTDPAGLRGWLVLEAAGLMYDGGNQSAYASALLRAGTNVTGTNAAALVAPLQSGQIQLLFIYRSAAVADHIAYIQLDRHVNLGDASLGTFYSKVSYKDSAGVTAGSPIVLCVTVPLSSTNAAEADAFVVYVIKNAATLSAYGLNPFSPAKLYDNVAPPTAISQLESQGLLVVAGSLP